MLEYTISDAGQDKYEKELQLWLDNQWLLSYTKIELGSPMSLILLMAVVRENKQKVQSVLDYKNLTIMEVLFTVDADMCTQKLREWW